jgi:hypothetical protein
LAQTAPNLGAAQGFAVLGGSAVDNAGGVATQVNGDLGISPNTAAAITGAFTISGSTFAGPASAATNAQNARATAYLQLQQPCNFVYGPVTDIGGLTLFPGVHCFDSSAAITGDVRLDALGNPNALFIFRTGVLGASTLGTAGGARVLLQGGAQACNIFWAVSSSATIGATNTFVGNILAVASITVGNASHMFGRVLAQAAVNLQNDIIDATVCAGVANGGSPCGGSVIAPTITAIPSQIIPVVPVGGSVSVGFTIGGGIINDGLGVTVRSSDTTLVPASAMTITKGAGGARVLTIFGADGRSGVTTITITVTDPTVLSCDNSTSRSFQLTVGPVAVPTMPQWVLMLLGGLLAAAGLFVLRRPRRADLFHS